MTMFTSSRERRLWISTCLVIVAVFASLPFAGTLAAVVDEPVAEALFVAGFLSIGAGLALFALLRRPAAAELWAGLAIGAVYMLLFSRMSIPAERTHLIEYGVIAVLIRAALAERSSRGRFRHNPSLASLIAASLLGALDELVQGVIPSRVFDWRDIGFNSGAALLAILATQVLTWARRASDRDRSGTDPPDGS